MEAGSVVGVAGKPAAAMAAVLRRAVLHIPWAAVVGRAPASRE